MKIKLQRRPEGGRIAFQCQKNKHAWVSVKNDFLVFYTFNKKYPDSPSFAKFIELGSEDKANSTQKEVPNEVVFFYKAGEMFTRVY